MEKTKGPDEINTGFIKASLQIYFPEANGVGVTSISL